MDTSSLQKAIEALDLKRNSGDFRASEREAIHAAISALDCGHIRVATPKSLDGEQSWETHAWVKKAVLAYFKITEMEEISCPPFSYRDKIPLKQNFDDLNVRVVPPATARFGSFMEAGVVLMPSYVNIGAWIGENSMVDTWATVGSCAQIGRNVHLSGGVGIGGVLEPATAQPVIIEDGAFVGSRSIVVEGVRIGKEAVLAANLTLTGSTPIIDTRKNTFEVLKGYVPPRTVLVPGTQEKKKFRGVQST